MLNKCKINMKRDLETSITSYNEAVLTVHQASASKSPAQCCRHQSVITVLPPPYLCISMCQPSISIAHTTTHFLAFGMLNCVQLDLRSETDVPS